MQKDWTPSSSRNRSPFKNAFPSSPWDEFVARDISFDPWRHFETMQFIDLGEENPQWRTITAKERELDAKQGKVSLREKYKK